MARRFVSIWFPHLKTDWFIRRHASLKECPFVLASPSHGKMMVRSVNYLAEKQGVFPGMALADARAIVPGLEVRDDDETLEMKLLTSIGAWCIRFTPSVAVDLPAGLMMDVTGCAHLWGGEEKYLAAIESRISWFGYHIRIALADTMGASWAVSRYGTNKSVVPVGQQMEAVIPLPGSALRIAPETAERLEKVGLKQIGSFINLPRPSLRRRFGEQLLHRLDEALGNREENITPLVPALEYIERLPCLDPVLTATGIEIALKHLLDQLCSRLTKAEMGLRLAIFKSYRVDGKIEMLTIGTNHPSSNPNHLYKLFENKIEEIEPALGIELFTLESPKVEESRVVQDQLWPDVPASNRVELEELLDRIEGKMGPGHVHRFVPDEHHWPERSFRPATTLNEPLPRGWLPARLRPLILMKNPEKIEVTAPIPDYPPMLFRYKGQVHKIIRADGPERIEQEWWLQEGQHRDYYCLEDEEGKRYWIFRLGHYDEEKNYQWFIHGLFP